MSGLSGNLVIALAIYTLIVAGLSALINLATRRFLRGVVLVIVTVCLAVAVTLIGFASGMAKSDFTFPVALPFLVSGAIVALIWVAALKRKVSTNG